MPIPNVKLGKRAPRLDPRNLKLARYLSTAVTPPVPEPAAEVSWVMKVPPPWNMYLNDQLGCCVIAAVGHMIQQMTFFADKPFIPTDNDILEGYKRVGGYIPGDPSTDQGCYMLDALKFWRHTGLAGHKILAFVAVDPGNLHEIRQAIALFGSVFIGAALPLSAQEQSAWTVPQGGPVGDGSPGSWGGHAVPIMASSPMSHTVVTWGERLKMSHNFLNDYCDEMYAVVSTDFIDKGGLSPSGFNLNQLLSDLNHLS